MNEVNEESLDRTILPFKSEVQGCSNYVVYLTHNGKSVYLFLTENDFFELTGKTSDKTSEINIACLNSCIHADDLDLFRHEFLLNKNNTSFSIRVIKPDNTILVSSITLTECNLEKGSHFVVYNATLNNVKDMLVPEEVDSAWRNNFDVMLKHTNDFIFFKNLHHVLTASSQTLADITGFEKGSDLIGLTDYDLFPKEHADMYYKLEKEIYQSKIPFIEETQPFFDANGNEGWVNNRKYPIKDQEGAIIGLFGIARVVTEEVMRKKELETVHKQLIQFANYDSLTSLFNRRYGLTLCERAFEETKRYGGELSIILFDVDHFKKVNDVYGHKCGDNVLAHLSKIIGNMVRETDIFLRYGGEEFIICMPRTDLNGANRIAERINTKLSNSKIESINDRVTVSGGVVQMEKENTINSLIHRADQLLYEAKAAGRNCFKF